MNLYLLQLSREMGKLGAAVDIFTRRHDASQPEVMTIGEKVRLIHLAAGEPDDVPKTNVYHYLPQFLSNLRRFLERDGIAYDLLHSHYWLSAWVAEEIKVRLGIRHIATFHTLGEIKNRARPAEREPALRLRAERQAIASANGIIAFSAEERDNMTRIYGAPPAKVRVIPCGVDPALFHPLDKERTRRELGLPGRSKVLLFAGRIQPIKGIDILLGAVARLAGNQVRLLIVGGNSASEDELARLCSLANELGIRDKVNFLGAVEHGRMPLLYSAADVCIVPSYHETFGLVALEALACGTPVVATRVGGLTTIVQDRITGHLVDELSPEAFARSLESLLGDEALRQRMAEAARPSVMKYAWPLVAPQVLQTYEELIGA
jgi:D-inositol-3-phosphate glycosyltransferase